nr:FAD-binding domain-containing protein [Paraburkholderia sp. BL10I2N1]
MAGSAGTLFKSLRTGAATWLSELIWRDFYFMVPHHHPGLADGALFKPEFDAIQRETGKHADGAFPA